MRDTDVRDTSDVPVIEPPRGAATFIGTATVLLRLGSFTILTDPNFLHQGDHAKLGGGLRSRRLTQPAMSIDQLPALDFVLLSHHHGDHFDEIAQRDLPKDVPIVTTPHAARKLHKQGFSAPRPMRTWQRRRLVKGADTLTVTSLPGKHAPDPLAKVLPPVMGSLVEFTRPSRPPFRIYITGDTLMHDRLHEIPQRFPDLDLALVHLGGTRIMGVLLTMDGAQGVELLRLVTPRTAIPIHYDDYTVFKSPLADFRHAVDDAQLATDVTYLQRGETYEFSL